MHKNADVLLLEVSGNGESRKKEQRNIKRALDFYFCFLSAVIIPIVLPLSSSKVLELKALATLFVKNYFILINYIGMEVGEESRGLNCYQTGNIAMVLSN